MRFPSLALAALCIANPASAQQAGGDLLFVSPMGEPFLGTKAAPPDLAWFDGADANHDGKLTLAEMRTDAARFYRTLDADRSGEIDPTEIERYETLIAREIALRDRGGGGPEGDATLNGPDSMEDMPEGPVHYVGQGGAALFNYFGLPEPVASADANFNRGISGEEFLRAAEQRFEMLDTNHDGVVARDELPPAPRGSKRKAKRR
jgi:EF hand